MVLVDLRAGLDSIEGDVLQKKWFDFDLGIQFFSESYVLGVPNIMLGSCFYRGLCFLKVGGCGFFRSPLARGA